MFEIDLDNLVGGELGVQFQAAAKKSSREHARPKYTIQKQKRNYY